MALSCIHGGICTGCSECAPDPILYKCPICGAELDADDEVYLSPDDGTVFGCWQCLISKKAEEVLVDD